MPSPFKDLSQESKVSEQNTAAQSAAMHKPSGKFTTSMMREWAQKSKATKKSSICALMVGVPKIGKSGVLLDVRSDDEIKEGKQLAIFELNSDQGCDVNKKEFHYGDEDIFIFNPREYTQDKEGRWIPDYIATMEKIKTTIQMIKEDVENIEKHLKDPTIPIPPDTVFTNLKAIGFDGLDIFLSEICESQMRMDENIDAAGGVSMRYWKNRNKFYYDTINMILDIDVDKYFITHYAPRSRDDKTGLYNDKRAISKLNDSLVYACQKSTHDKMHQIIEFSDETRIIGGKKKIKVTATMVGDRRSLNSYMDVITIAETGPDGKVIWNGKQLLERKWN